MEGSGQLLKREIFLLAQSFDRIYRYWISVHKCGICNKYTTFSQNMGKNQY
jgi:hypothetical protein